MQHLTLEHDAGIRCPDGRREGRGPRLTCAKNRAVISITLTLPLLVSHLSPCGCSASAYGRLQGHGKETLFLGLRILLARLTLESCGNFAVATSINNAMAHLAGLFPWVLSCQTQGQLISLGTNLQCITSTGDPHEDISRA